MFEANLPGGLVEGGVARDGLKHARLRQRHEAADTLRAHRQKGNRGRRRSQCVGQIFVVRRIARAGDQTRCRGDAESDFPESGFAPC